jgi:threonine dehydratase
MQLGGAGEANPVSKTTDMPDRFGSAELATRIDLEAARRAIADVALRTPTVPCDDLYERSGGPVVLKAECVQRTGSFKLRGALSKIAALGADAAAGLVTASAGNHGRAVAYAARARGVPCEVFMPREAAISKVASVESLGATVRAVGQTVDDAIAAATARAGETGAAFIHPFDDVDVIAGQGTVGVELLEDVPEVARIIVPIGGGGLAAGVGVAVKHRRAEVRLVGVQADACAPFAALADGAGAVPTSVVTIADGIAIKRPGQVTRPLIEEFVDDICVVSEEEIAAGMVFMVERAKLVAEGAGAVGVAALLAGRLPEAPGTTAVIVSGGNVDAGLLAAILSRHETEAGRHVRLFTRVADRPGGLAALLTLVADQRANLLTIEHRREGVPLHVRETGVELTLETRGPVHTEQLVKALRAAGYDVHVEIAHDDAR